MKIEFANWCKQHELATKKKRLVKLVQLQTRMKRSK